MPESGGSADQRPPGSPASEAPQDRCAAPDVFLSYASHDAAIADAVVVTLEHQGLKCWIAPRDVTPGTFYGDEIVHAIDAAKASVLILSQNAAASQHVLREVERAASKRHPVVSLRIDQAPLPAGLEYFLNTSQWLDASGGDLARSMPKLIAAVRVAVKAHVVPAVAPPAARTSAPSASAVSAKRTAIVVALLIALVMVGFAADRLWVWSHRSEPVMVPTVKGPPPALAPAIAAIPEKSVAVLPFVDMSEKRDQEYFADGLSEELIDLLTKTADLQVPARTSSFYFKGKSEDIPTIAKRLMVANVLEGSVRKSGNHLRVTAQLVRADNGFHLWSETYDRQLNDIFKVQDDIANAVVAALKLKLVVSPSARDRQTTNPEAYNQYLIGRHIYDGGNWQEDNNAAFAFRKAVDLDPDYATAWAGLAVATSEFAVTRPPDEWNVLTQEALRAADKAIAIHPDVADGFGARGYIRSQNHFDFRGASEDFKHALTLEPDNSGVLLLYAMYLLRPTGHLDEGIAAMQKALKSDPLNAEGWRGIGMLYFFRGDSRMAREALQRSLEINPKQPDTAAIDAYTSLVEGQPAIALSVSSRATSECYQQQVAALAEHDLGHTPAAQRWLGDLIAKHAGGCAYQIAEVYAWWGDNNQAIAWLERSYTQKDSGLLYVKPDRLLNRLHADPRFTTFLLKMNLPE